MRNTLALLFVLICGFMFSQISELSKIDKEVSNRYSKISKKDLRKFPEQSKLEMAKIEDYRNEEYRKVVANIQKDEIKVDLNSIEKNPTKSAEFEGGINEFRKLLANNFDTSILESGTGTLKTEIQFLVDEKGIPSNVEATGNSNLFSQVAIITLYRTLNNTKWKPAEKDGVAVKSVYKLPLTIQFSK
ncbi:energy transducer TonB [Halpernia frigidisoli]|uniref:TonB C-terminal domain-containing protein n=1 Tax=Halpernia frigidisoli TaxID=1125876 RepID=A0A1I3GW50_9FLAO|nr:hypothetical protein [Halpernia frigidisoli]SFI27590.1 hypothetical protein SAMN05443292_2050 [Halpernia frigidisoli]